MSSNQKAYDVDEEDLPLDPCWLAYKLSFPFLYLASQHEPYSHSLSTSWPATRNLQEAGQEKEREDQTVGRETAIGG